MVKPSTYVTTDRERTSTSIREESSQYINLHDPCEPTQPCGGEEQ